MLLITYLLTIASFALGIGALARLLHPGHDDLGFAATIAIGLAGLVGGGLLTRLLWLHSGLLGLAFAVGVAVVLVWAVAPQRQTV